MQVEGTFSGNELHIENLSKKASWSTEAKINTPSLEALVFNCWLKFCLVMNVAAVCHMVNNMLGKHFL